MDGSVPTPRAPYLPLPHTRYWLPDDPSGTFKRNELWAVLLFHLLTAREAVALIRLAEEHAAKHGWSTRRHRNYPTTDIAVAPDTAPALHAALAPLVDARILPILAHYYSFALAELSMGDLFVVKYEAAAATGVQDRLAPHRDGNLLSFSILLSDPHSDFDGGGLRFHSLGPECDNCGSRQRAASQREACGVGGILAACLPSVCAKCNNVGRLVLSDVGIGDLTTHCGKLLHEAARVSRGRRFVVIGFVHVRSPRIASGSARGFAQHHSQQ